MKNTKPLYKNDYLGRFKRAKEYNTLVNDAILGFLELTSKPVSYIYNKRKTDIELHMLENVYQISRYPSKQSKESICLLCKSNYKSIKLWIKNKRNSNNTNKDDDLMIKNTIISVYNHNAINNKQTTAYDLATHYYNNTLLHDFFLEHPEIYKNYYLENKESYADLPTLFNLDINHDDILNLFVIKGDQLFCKYQAEIYYSENLEKNKSCLITTDYLFSIVYENLIPEDKELFLKIRRFNL